MSRQIHAVAVVAALSMSCVSSGKKIDGIIKAERPMSVTSWPYASASVVTTAANPDWSPEAEELAKAVLVQLRASGLFKEVVLGERPGTPSDLRIEASLFELRRVSSSDRSWWGNGAGQARVLATVAVVESASKGLVASGAVGGLAYGGINGGTTSDATEEAARQLVRFLQGNTRGTVGD